MPRQHVSLFWPAVSTCVAIAILLSLGVWQLHRLEWKEGLIARIEARANTAPQPLPSIEEWPNLRPEDYEYRHVTLTGTFNHGQEALVFQPSGGAAGKEPGYLVLTPLGLKSGGYVIVNRGFVPMDHKEQSSRLAGQLQGETEVTGLMRQPETRGFFTPADDPAAGHFFTRDPGLIAKHFGLAPAAPFSIDADSTSFPRGWPATTPNLPNNHLAYALTWFGLALAALGVFAAFARQRLGGAGQ
ncbi:MAG TPA: SURF1 family protein [Methylocella sp.]|nr:SURF1 family protein [Methylocella sp.]